MSLATWAARRARAARLLREAPHAEEMLVFYIGLTELQERVAEKLAVERIRRLLHAGATSSGRSRSGQGDSPPLRVAALPLDELLPAFEDFLVRLANVGTDPIATGAQAILDAEVGERETALRQATSFPARAFLEPVMTTLGAAGGWPNRGEDPGRCPTCGAAPVVGVLQDLPDALGSRSLVCSLCATEWRIDRLRCARCGEADAAQLFVHTAESVAYVRLDECRTCACYLKTVDLRARGDAVPVVDELATVELDLWARERGLTKLQRNILEL